MSDIDLTEAVEAATSAVTYVRDAHPRVSTDADSYDVADAAITAALPHIERQVREQVADEITAAHAFATPKQGSDDADAYARGFLFGLVHARHIARGEQL